ncbi:MAG: uracil-DNA glycosylase family protein [bacterium]|nr:uracil-DNA glycosylase family protein [bacterium]
MMVTRWTNVDNRSTALQQHIDALQACRQCSAMQPQPVAGQAVYSKIMLLGQAPGDKEPVMQRPFAWTAGKTLFKWFQDACGVDEATFRSRVYMAAVCRCFPGKKPRGGDRVPSAEEINNCARWLQAEMALLKPALVLPVGKLAIAQLMDYQAMETHIGQQFRCTYAGYTFDAIPLPHPSGASPWPRMEPGKTLLNRALRLIAEHPAMVCMINDAPVR